jgi:hypothetical protein
MPFESIACFRLLAVLGGLLAGATVPFMALARPPAATEQLDAAFRNCVGLYSDPLAGALMRTIGDGTARASFAAEHPAAVRGFSIEREHGYATATAKLNDGVSVAGVPVRAIYASTCELECALAVWGLEFGPLKVEQIKALQAWAESAPSTHTPTHGDIQVQLNTTSEGETLLVCDVSD